VDLESQTTWGHEFNTPLVLWGHKDNIRSMGGLRTILGRPEHSWPWHDQL
jgi:hypothetical protein